MGSELEREFGQVYRVHVAERIGLPGSSAITTCQLRWVVDGGGGGNGETD